MPIEDYCEELDAMLAASEESSLSLEEVHGFMSAALCGPQPLSFRDCVCAIFLPEAGDAEISECELPSSLLDLLGTLYEDTQRSIEDGSFLPIVSCEQADDDDVDARLWCCGFLMCMEYSRPRWKLDNDRVLELVTPIVLLADDREFERAAEQFQEIGAESFRQELLEVLPGSVGELRQFFKKSAHARRPPRAAARPVKKRRIARR